MSKKIEAKELRIGILIQDLNGCKAQIVGLFENQITCDFEKNDLCRFSNEEIELLQGIPLTKEWLLKFGFDDLGKYGYGIGKFRLEYTKNLQTKQDCDFVFFIGSEIVRMKFVHQLQNLYFALTKQELEIKN